LNDKQVADIVDFYRSCMVEKGGSNVVVKAGSCMKSQQEIRPNSQAQYPSDIYVSHVVSKTEYNSYPMTLDAEGLLQQLMRNNCGDKCANVRTDKGNTAKPKRGAREINTENPGKIYINFTNCTTKSEYEVKYQSYYMKQKVRSNVEVDENGRKRHLTDKTGRKPDQRTLVNIDDLYTVKCRHCDTVRSINNAPTTLHCSGVCKKTYRCNLELGSNKHWEVIY
jgi:hypothetical protein